MKNTEKTLNPEIRKQTEKLFNLIENEIAKNHPDPICEAIAEQMGDFLKGSKGFDNLAFSCQLAKTKSESATMNLNEASMYLNDDALYDLHYLQRRVFITFEGWEQFCREPSDDNWHCVDARIKKCYKGG
jgi:hypothetical protein